MGWSPGPAATSGDDTFTGTAGDDTAFGLGGNDTLNGGAGNDYLYGGTGIDTLIGGPGNDTFAVMDSFDTIVENVNEGADTVEYRFRINSTSFSLADIANVENIHFVFEVFTLGTTPTITATGNDLNNFIDVELAHATNDIFDGGAGDDTLSAGTGDDIYIVDSYGDTIIEGAGNGNDTIRTSLNNYSLAAANIGEVENLTFTGAGVFVGTGNALNNTIAGGSGDDTLSGGDGNDRLIGGTGADVLDGGNGNNTADYSTSGAAVSIDLLAGTHSGGDADGDVYSQIANITGSAFADTLAGSHGVNVLSGGAGNDTLISDTLDGDTYDGGNGIDVLDLSQISGGLTIDMALSIGGTFISIETVLGGAGNDAITADNGANTLDGAGGDDTLNGAAGDDTLDGGVGADILRGGDGNDTLFGQEGDDAIQGGNGNDTIAGSDGADTILGDAGNDIIHGNAGDDVITGSAGVDQLFGDDGNDTFVAVGNDFDIMYGGAGVNTVDYSAMAVAGSVNLTVGQSSGFGRSSGDGLNAIQNVIGGSANDTLIGDDLSNILNGSAGADSMSGGLGDDTYVVDNVGDNVNENPGEGADTVQASITYTLTSNVENLVLLAGALNGTGDDLANIITGNSAANTLDGGLGADTLIGGLGDDTYIVDNAGDVATENASEGIDTVLASITFALAANVENLTLTGSNAIDGAGNALANSITGNIAANVLDGGAGADTLIGGAGDDTYIVDNAGDAPTENAGEGTDTVQSSITWTLGAALENLTLTGAATIDGTGNTLSNLLTGNDAANILNGKTGDDVVSAAGGADTLYGGDGNDALSGGVGADFLDGGNHNDSLSGGDDNDTLYGRAGNDTLDGGAGADTMFGGAGDDIYFVDNAGDAAAESSAAGNDTIMASVTYGLGAYIENLTLTGVSAINGTGNILANSLTGNDAANVLSGLAGFDTLSGMGGDDTLNGGNGNDTLFGGTGADILDGGNDLDTLNGGDGADTLYGRTSADTLNGDAGNDTLYGGDGDDILNGGDDNDLLDAGNHNDTLSGGAGDDTLYGRQNDDTLSGDAGSDTLFGGDGNDSLNGGAGVDALNGGNGDDAYYVDNAGDTVSESGGGGVDIVYASVSFTLGSGLENLTLTGNGDINGTGNDGANTITGNDGANILESDGGIDTLSGLGGDDVLGLTGAITFGSASSVDGGDGTDTLRLNADTPFESQYLDSWTLSSIEHLSLGGDGTSTYYFSAQSLLPSNLAVDATEASGHTVFVALRNLTPGAVNIDLSGWTFADWNGFIYLYGDNSNEDVIGGSSQLDTVYGYGGNDTLSGNGGNDFIFGGDGNDSLNGGAGVDALDGGNGDDVFAFTAGEASGDTINDFVGNGAAAGDTLVFSGYGLVANGASFIQLDATHWQINSADGTIHDVITLANSASVDASDYVFGP